jgi:glucokinase
MVFLTAGTGTGSGLILDGRLYSGANGNAGEVGHVRLASDGPEGYGKRGSFEGFCSGAGIARLAALRARERDIVLPPGTDAQALARAARAGDPFAAAVWREAGTRLGEALAIVIDVLNPERVVIGSLFVRCRDLLEEPMWESIRKEALAPAAEVCEVLPAALGEALGVHAAVSVALHHLERARR